MDTSDLSCFKLKILRFKNQKSVVHNLFMFVMLCLSVPMQMILDFEIVHSAQFLFV